MIRRDFIRLLGGAAAAWPIVARAEQASRLPTIGLLGSSTPSAWAPWTTAFQQRLRELGVSFQQIVHPVLTEETEVAEASDSEGKPDEHA
jgi:hypothetical protein